MTARISRYFRTRQVGGRRGLFQRPGGSEVGKIYGILTKITIFTALCPPLHVPGHVRPTVVRRADFLSSAEGQAGTVERAGGICVIFNEKFLRYE